MSSDKKTVAIVGAGLVGSGWSLVFARAGFNVSVFDPNILVRERYQDWLRKTLSTLTEYSLIDNRDEIVKRITICSDLKKCLANAFYVQESVYETLESKREASEQIDTFMSPDAIVGSSSSGIPSSEFTGNCKNKSRFLINHPVNPPHLIPVVEIVPSSWTNPNVVAEVKNLMAISGQSPVVLKKEVDGFILNRLQGALLNEAWALYEEGIASTDDIDRTVRDGLGLRWSFMGPFETIDLNAPDGIADYADRFSSMYFNMGHSRLKHPWPKDVIDKAEQERRKFIENNKLAEKSSWRDSILMKLIRFKQINKLK